MSNKVITETVKAGKKEILRGKLEGIYFAYVKLQDGEFKKNSTTEKEFVVNVVMSEDQADDYSDMFPGNGVNAIKTAEFEAKYKFPPPYPNEKKQYVTKIKQGTTFARDMGEDFKKGDKLPYTFNTRPKAFLAVDGGVKDITMNTLIGNGSKGDIGFNISSNSYGTFPHLVGILVKDLVEYEQKSDSGSSSMFGNVVGGLDEGDGTVQQVATYSEIPDGVEESENPAPQGMTESNTAADESSSSEVDSDSPF